MSEILRWVLETKETEFDAENYTIKLFFQILFSIHVPRGRDETGTT